MYFPEHESARSLVRVRFARSSVRVRFARSSVRVRFVRSSVRVRFARSPLRERFVRSFVLSCERERLISLHIKNTKVTHTSLSADEDLLQVYIYHIILSTDMLVSTFKLGSY